MHSADAAEVLSYVMCKVHLNGNGTYDLSCNVGISAFSLSYVIIPYYLMVLEFPSSRAPFIPFLVTSVSVSAEKRLCR